MTPDYKALLKVHVKRANNLTASDFLSCSSDPYVVGILADQRLKTRTVRRSLNPEWNDRLTFGIPEDYPSLLKLVVMDEDKFSKDEILAQINVDLNPLISISRKFLMEKEMDLKDMEGKEIMKITPSSLNNLVMHSSIWISKGEIIQNLCLRLKTYEYESSIEIDLMWKNV
eukprot:TRINITY_DN35279_c0_g1_i1.p1 TRINITY_DN35279_c0_g1~~TRINITY_DN35279_c0_g1_i1.p1  ORF type:complete len:171 (-),score=29.81 TRINITY_DN35279_c0_g1_i1:31-543(-)